MSKFPKFQVWDSVRVTHPGYWFDKVGTVTDRDADGDRCYVVSFPDRAPANFTADELILADVVEDAKAVKHGADCPWCAPEPQPAICDPSLWSIPQRHYVGMDPEDITTADLVEANNAKFVAKMNAAAEAEPVNVRAQILRTSEKLINGQRAKDYGDACENFQRIADLWAPVLRTPVTAEQVALCMAQVKIARLITSPGHEDSWIDLAGYAALGGEIASDGS